MRLPLSALLGGLLLAACGGDPQPPPELLQRGTVSPGEIDPLVADGGWEVVLSGDAGTEVTGDCCVLPFALAREEGEVSAELVFPSMRYAMGAADGGAWQVEACVELVPGAYYYRTALAADDDAGVLWVNRVNPAVPTEASTAVLGQVNVFDVPDGGTCESFDGALHATIPDAGP